jgi:hypothetical protein
MRMATGKEEVRKHLDMLTSVIVYYNSIVSGSFELIDASE